MACTSGAQFSFTTAAVPRLPGVVVRQQAFQRSAPYPSGMLEATRRSRNRQQRNGSNFFAIASQQQQARSSMMAVPARQGASAHALKRGVRAFHFSSRLRQRHQGVSPTETASRLTAIPRTVPRPARRGFGFHLRGTRISNTSPSATVWPSVAITFQIFARQRHDLTSARHLPGAVAGRKAAGAQ